MSTENPTYGFKKEGKSRFVIVVPHATGDDKRSGKLASLIADKLSAFLIINTKYIKPDNSKAKANLNLVRDFNIIPKATSLSNKKSKKELHHKEFYDDIQTFVKSAQNYNSKGKAVIVYIHGMVDNPRRIEIDIGCGLKEHNGILLGTNKHPHAGSNSGEIRAGQRDMEKLRTLFEEQLLHLKLNAGIGIFNAAWSRKNGIQFHAGTKDSSFQLEISCNLRKPDNLNSTSDIIVNSIKEVFKD